jgi:hypothetical protein
MSVWSDTRLCAVNDISLWHHVWQRESGPDRVAARAELRRAIAYFRTYFLAPERAAFDAAVARTHRRAAA